MGLTKVSTKVQKPSQEQGRSDEPDWFSELVERSNNSEEELLELVDEKIDQFQGLVTGRGPAAILVGYDQGIDLVDELGQQELGLDVENIVTGMSDLCIKAEIVEKTGVNSFDGGKVANWIVEDDSGRTQVAFWNDDVEDLYQEFSVGDTVKFSGAYTKQEISDYQSDRFGVACIQIGDEAAVSLVD